MNNVKTSIMMLRGDQLKRMILLNVDVSFTDYPKLTQRERKRVTERIRHFICEIASALVIRSIVDHISRYVIDVERVHSVKISGLSFFNC